MEQPVKLYLYDLSKGGAALLSRALLGKKIDGIWHSSVVIFEREYFFGEGGIEECEPGGTVLGEPLRVIQLGVTQVTFPIFKEYLRGLGESSFGDNTYDIITHNCNHFSEELANFLCGGGIPKYILDLPEEVLNSPAGGAIKTLISQLEKCGKKITNYDVEGSKSRREGSPGLDALNTQIEEARYFSFLLEKKRQRTKEKLAKKERKKQKRRELGLEQDFEEQDMAEMEAVNGAEPPTVDQLFEMDEEEKREEEERKKAREPPVVYKGLLDIKIEFDALVGLIDGKLNADEQQSLEELHSYMITDEGSWALGESFLVFIDRLLNDKELPEEVRIRTLNVLAIAALKDDVILLLHQDRKDHVLMNFAFNIDRHSTAEQEALSLFIANMFENLSSSEWLLYISEWPYNNQQISNIRVTTKVAVHSLLSEIPALQDRGAAIVHNLACKEVKTVVFDDVAVELTMALLQFFHNKPPEELLFRCMKALAKFVQISRQEVPQLIQMIGPDPKTFKGVSPRIDEFIEQISSKIR